MNFLVGSLAQQPGHPRNCEYGFPCYPHPELEEGEVQIGPLGGITSTLAAWDKVNDPSTHFAPRRLDADETELEDVGNWEQPRWMMEPEHEPDLPQHPLVLWKFFAELFTTEERKLPDEALPEAVVVYDSASALAANGESAHRCAQRYCRVPTALVGGSAERYAVTVPTVAAAERLGVPHLEGLFSRAELRITVRATGSGLWRATTEVDAMRRRDILGWGSRLRDGLELPTSESVDGEVEDGGTRDTAFDRPDGGVGPHAHDGDVWPRDEPHVTAEGYVNPHFHPGLSQVREEVYDWGGATIDDEHLTDEEFRLGLSRWERQGGPQGCAGGACCWGCRGSP